MSTYDIDFIVQRFEANIYLVGGDVETYFKSKSLLSGQVYVARNVFSFFVL